MTYGVVFLLRKDRLKLFCRCYRVIQSIVILALSEQSESKGKNPGICLCGCLGFGPLRLLQNSYKKPSIRAVVSAQKNRDEDTF